jgi:hypothetical protein
MNVQEAMDMQGRLTLQKRNAANEIIEEIAAANSIVVTGRDLVARLFISQEGVKSISHMAVGAGSAKVDPAQKGLDHELFRKPINLIDPTKHLVETANNRKKVTVTAELDFNEPEARPDGEPHLLTEAGLFNADKEGVMYNRVVFPSISKTTDFKLTLIWEIIF